MSGGQSGEAHGLVAGARPAAVDDLDGRVVGAENEVLRLHLAPFEGGLVAVDLHDEVVLLAGGDLAGEDESAHAVGEAEHHAAVVVEPASGHEGREVGGDLEDGHSGDELDDVLGVGADVGHASGDAGLLGIDAPGGLLAGVGGGEPAQGVLHVDLPDLAQGAAGDQLSGLADHRVAGVVVEEAEHPAGLLHQRLQRERLGGVHGEGLLADDVEAGLQECLGDLVVAEVRRADGDEIDALVLRKRQLLLDHVLVVGVAASGSQVEPLGELRGLRRVPSEDTADQVDLAVHSGGDAVDFADEGVIASADHAHSEFA